MAVVVRPGIVVYLAVVVESTELAGLLELVDSCIELLVRCGP